MKEGMMQMPMNSLKTQAGLVLDISLIMLLLTLIGVSGMQATGMEEKMAGNMRDRNVAFQAAEAALRIVEQYVVDNVDNGNVDSKATVIGEAQSPFVLDTTISGLSAQPTYTITLIAVDYYPTNPSKYATFKITATAYGGSSSTEVTLETIYITQVADSIATI